MPTLQLKPTRAKRSRAVTASFFHRTSPSWAAITPKAKATELKPSRALSYPPPLKSDGEATAAAKSPFVSLISSTSVSGETRDDHRNPPAGADSDGGESVAPARVGADTEPKSGRSPVSVRNASSKKLAWDALSHVGPGGVARSLAFATVRARPICAAAVWCASRIQTIATHTVTAAAPQASVQSRWSDFRFCCWANRCITIRSPIPRSAGGKNPSTADF